MCLYNYTNLNKLGSKPFDMYNQLLTYSLWHPNNGCPYIFLFADYWPDIWYYCTDSRFVVLIAIIIFIILFSLYIIQFHKIVIFTLLQSSGILNIYNMPHFLDGFNFICMISSIIFLEYVCSLILIYYLWTQSYILVKG